MASCLVFYSFIGIFTLTRDLDIRSRSSSLGSLIIVQYVTHFGEILTLAFDLNIKVTSIWVIECALLGCTLVPSMKSVGEIASFGQVHRYLGH